MTMSKIMPIPVIYDLIPLRAMRKYESSFVLLTMLVN